MNTVRIMFCVAGVLALAACAPTAGYQPDKYRVAENGSVELTQTLRFPGRSARAYIQFGETMRRGLVDEWAPYCSFGLNWKRDGEPMVREVEPTVFTVTDTQFGVDVAGRSDDVGPGDNAPNQVAGLFGGGHGRDGTPSLYIYYTTLTLYSEQQPQVDDLTCAYRGSRIDRNLTVEEIRETLGDIARIR